VAADEIGCKRRQPIELVLGISILDRYVLALDIAGFLQSLEKRNGYDLGSSADWGLRKPTTGSAGCCPRATTGHAAALPSPAMNCRRLIESPRRTPHGECCADRLSNRKGGPRRP
jgi:hypothetical protein